MSYLQGTLPKNSQMLLPSRHGNYSSGVVTLGHFFLWSPINKRWPRLTRPIVVGIVPCNLLCANPKQPDSSGTAHTLVLTLFGSTFQNDFGDAVSGITGPTDYNSPVQAPKISNLSYSFKVKVFNQYVVNYCSYTLLGLS